MKEIPSTSISNNYTTSSGRIVKNPNNFSVTAANVNLTQKRVRIGAVTRSLISSSNSIPNNSMSVDHANATKFYQNSENLTTVKVSGPTILPIMRHDSEHFIKVLIMIIEALNKKKIYRKIHYF